MALRVDLRKRCCRPEIMDQPGLDARCHREALRGLARINFWSGSARILWRALRRLCPAGAGGPLRLLDLACGAGDVPIRLWHRARRAGMALEVDGCDVSGCAVAHAQKRAAACGTGVRFFAWDALADPLLSGYDVVTSSLFLHHLADDRAVILLQRMARMAGRLVLVNDLRRSLAGFLLACAGTRLLSASRVVHTDGPQSVEAAFTQAEMEDLARRAGLAGAVVEPRWPFRLLLSWERDECRTPNSL
jgi:SAM-dependent methyltransferase